MCGWWRCSTVSIIGLKFQSTYVWDPERNLGLGPSQIHQDHAAQCQEECHDGVDGEKLRAMLLINPTKSTLLLILNRGEVGPKTQGRPLVSGSTGNRYFFNLLQSNFQPVT